MIHSKNYTKTIKADVDASKATDRIGRVSEWWSTDFQGTSKDVHDIFTVRFGNGDMYKVTIAEIIPHKKIVWEVIDSYQSWVKNPTEWVGTKIVWDITENKDGVEVCFTHVGLVPALECFDKCTAGWNYLMLESLSKLLNTGKGLPVGSK